MKALIDGDIIVYRIAHTTVNEEERIAAYRAAELVDGICAGISSNVYSMFLSDATANNFRSSIYPEYKANRPKEKPPHYNFLREFLVREFDAEVCAEEEADDRMGILQTDSTIICTIDKDLDQIPGWHYNFVKKEKYHVTPEDGMKWFYMQLLMGDITENVPGIVGVGKARASEILEGAVGESELFSRVVSAYKKWGTRIGKGEQEIMDLILTYGRVLKIRQEEEEVWNFPVTNTTTPQPSTAPQ